ncbi:SPOR domain-containing protein [Methylomonas fluvii]|uniref:SPOR domain-containing protein n=1 Tax=Methylomonas fluvii TaxID=1854564 RepID=A0ABR9DJN7_9GAMM|nr:SPOR domain-containing protein [Methylomonas fluvii]MBD9363313.1 SPOR domain-containing protein [Methylomonas fluvii]CAD6876578.1 Sporulation domain-containing protein [Methylomonas fluvii]
MDQELKQRLIGAAVITALAAIFVPMLFDDPIDETGKSINELKIPELPAKAQDVEIMPLPEKVEEVAETLPAANVPRQAVKVLEEGESEAELEVPKPQVKLTAKETAPAPRSLPAAKPAAAQAAAAAQIDEEPAEAEDVPPAVLSKPSKSPAPTIQPLQAVSPTPKVLKPVNKLPEPKAEVAAIPAQAPVPNAIGKAPAAAAEDNNRWYLQVGTFSQKPNAVSLQDNLKQQGFAASVREVASDKGTVFKVRIGPIVDKAKAQAVKAKLAQINVNSFVSADE